MLVPLLRSLRTTLNVHPCPLPFVAHRPRSPFLPMLLLAALSAWAHQTGGPHSLQTLPCAAIVGCSVYAAAAALYYHVVHIRVALAADFLASISIFTIDMAAYARQLRQWKRRHALFPAKPTIWLMPFEYTRPC